VCIARLQAEVHFPMQAGFCLGQYSRLEAPDLYACICGMVWEGVRVRVCVLQSRILFAKIVARRRTKPACVHICMYVYTGRHVLCTFVDIIHTYIHIDTYIHTNMNIHTNLDLFGTILAIRDIQHTQRHI
jgi:hypothetical protein